MLRDYQRHDSTAIKRTLESYQRVLYCAPTGSGKTTLVSHIFHGLYQRGLPAAFVVHRRELIRQVSDALHRSNVPHGIVCSGYEPQPLRSIQVCMVQTLARHPLRTAPWLAVVDECHHSVSPTYQRVLTGFPRLLGLTATPARLDGRGLGDIYQYMIHGPTVADLTAQGYLSPYRIWAPPGIDVKGIRVINGDFARPELARAADRPAITGDAIAHYQRLCDGRRFIVYCSSILHSQHVAAQFDSQGVPCVHVDGTTPDAERAAAFRDFEAGRILGLINVDLFGEGIDVPGIEAVILLRPTMSTGLYLQQVGRGLRPAEGKSCTYILDHAGNCERHGLPDDVREWTLNSNRRKRRNVESVLRIRVCPVCFAAVRVGVMICPLGHPFAVKTEIPDIKPGELQEIKRRIHKAQRLQESQCRTLADWQELARERGYSPGWARIRFNLRENHA